MKAIQDPKQTLIFVTIAAMLMLVVHFFFKDTFEKPAVNVPKAVIEVPVSINENEVRAPAVFSQDEWDAIEGAFDEPYIEYESPKEYAVSDPLHDVPDTKVGAPKKELEAAVSNLKPPEPFILPDGSKPKIAIIIDDMGMSRKNGFALIDIQYPLTLAFLPYAPKLNDMTKAAQDNGHQLMIHMPMEAMDHKQNLGGIALKKDMTAEAIEVQLDKAFDAFDGYVGLNNHMGSRLTQNEAAMQVVMKNLKERDLYFVDSKTIGSSVASKVAWANGLKTAERDIFLDHEDSITFVRKALRKMENAAKRKGYAIAIGHPKSATIKGLKEWLPTLEAKGFEVVHASELVRREGDAPIEELKIAQEPEARGLYKSQALVIDADPLGAKNVTERPAQSLAQPPE